MSFVTKGYNLNLIRRKHQTNLNCGIFDWILKKRKNPGEKQVTIQVSSAALVNGLGPELRVSFLVFVTVSWFGLPWWLRQ